MPAPAAPGLELTAGGWWRHTAASRCEEWCCPWHDWRTGSGTPDSSACGRVCWGPHGVHGASLFRTEAVVPRSCPLGPARTWRQKVLQTWRAGRQRRVPEAQMDRDIGAKAGRGNHLINKHCWRGLRMLVLPAVPPDLGLVSYSPLGAARVCRPSMLRKCTARGVVALGGRGGARVHRAR